MTHIEHDEGEHHLPRGAAASGNASIPSPRMNAKTTSDRPVPDWITPTFNKIVQLEHP
jgi:hypothetical protein